MIFNPIIQQNPGRYIKSDIIDKVLLKDLPSLYGITNVQELNSLFMRLAYQSGNEISPKSLSTSSGVKMDSLRKYLDYLEAAFLIKRVSRIDHNAKSFQRDAAVKIYLINPSLRSAVFSPIVESDESFGYMVETAIFSQMLHREWKIPYYANWTKGEVDMVFLNQQTQKPHNAVEIKWSNKCVSDKKELKSLLTFCKTHGLKKAIVTTIDKEDVVNFDGVTIYFYPSATYALTAGYKTIAKAH